MKDRFVNNRVLESICRPQYRYGCAIAALTSVINYLYSAKLGVVTQEQIARELNLEIRDIGTKIDPGNKAVMEWFSRFVKQHKLHGKVRIFTDNRTRKDFAALNALVKSPNKILMYHLENHYNIASGLYESALKPEGAYSRKADTNRWLILADSNDNPVWSRSWNDVLKSFRSWKGNCLMLFES
jgi:hypothetical protein